MNRELKQYEKELIKDMQSKNSFIADNAYVKLYAFYTELKKAGELTDKQYTDKLEKRKKIYLKKPL